jgi:hypothetical protein
MHGTLAVAMSGSGRCLHQTRYNSWNSGQTAG